MSIFIGGTEVEDILIGSTQINEVYIGSTLVWQRLSVTTNPASGFDLDLQYGAAATAQVDLSANRSVTWSFTQVSGTSAGLSYGPSSSINTYVRLHRAHFGTSVAVVDVTATVGNSTVTNRVSLEATRDTLGGNP